MLRLPELLAVIANSLAGVDSSTRALVNRECLHACAFLSVSYAWLTHQKAGAGAFCPLLKAPVERSRALNAQLSPSAIAVQCQSRGMRGAGRSASRIPSVAGQHSKIPKADPLGATNMKRRGYGRHLRRKILP